VDSGENPIACAATQSVPSIRLSRVHRLLPCNSPALSRNPEKKYATTNSVKRVALYAEMLQQLAEVAFIEVKSLLFDSITSLFLKEPQVWNFLHPRIRIRDLCTTYTVKSLQRAGAMVLVIFLAMPVHAERGQSWYKQGRDLEARQNYEAAYEAYRQAYEADPRNTRYRAALTRIRFLAGASEVHRATLLQQAGKLEEALTLFEQVVRIDPSSPIASQQVINTREMIHRMAIVLKPCPGPNLDSAPTFWMPETQ
jgi:tetratricopeptide (TPR) repeat protein